MPAPDFFTYACGVLVCKHWAGPGLLSISIQSKQAVFSPRWQRTKKSLFCRLVHFTSGWCLLEATFPLKHSLTQKYPFLFCLFFSLLYWDKIFTAMMAMTAEHGGFCW